jgi:chromate transport protein ChrA
VGAINRLGIVWGGVVLAFVLLLGWRDSQPDKLLVAWSVLTLPPWLLLHGLAWVFRGAR